MRTAPLVQLKGLVLLMMLGFLWWWWSLKLELTLDGVLRLKNETLMEGLGERRWLMVTTLQGREGGGGWGLNGVL